MFPRQFRATKGTLKWSEYSSERSFTNFAFLKAIANQATANSKAVLLSKEVQNAFSCCSPYSKIEILRLIQSKKLLFKKI